MKEKDGMMKVKHHSTGQQSSEREIREEIKILRDDGDFIPIDFYGGFGESRRRARQPGTITKILISKFANLALMISQRRRRQTGGPVNDQQNKNKN